MRKTTMRRFVAGVSAGAMAASFAAALGAVAADAAPISSPSVWTDGNSQFTRLVSNTNPGVGDTIELTTQFQRRNTKFNNEYIYNYKDLHDSCLVYAPGSANWQGNTSSPVRLTEGENADSVDGRSQDFVRFEAPGKSSWLVSAPIGNGWGEKVSISTKYTVSPDCPAGVDLMTTMHYGGSQGTGTYADKGPTVNVAFATSQTVVQPVYGAQVGSPSTIAAKVAGGTVPQNGGKVQFKVNGIAVGDPVEVDKASGIAQVAWTPDKKSNAITAEYLGNLNTKGSTSDPLSVTANEINQDSTVALNVGADPQVKKATSVSAQISPAGAGGTVTFLDNEVSFASNVPVSDANGKVTVAWVPATSGEHTIKAVFSGRDGVNGNGAQTTVSVASEPANSVESTTTISPVAPFDLGGTADLTAKVTSTGATNGTVTFKDGDSVIGTADVVGGTAVFRDWKPIAGGAHTITAQFSGINETLASSDSIDVTVNIPDAGNGDGEDNGNGGDPVDSGSTGSGSLDAPGSLDLGSLFGSLGSSGD